jgi:hypothetical protein
MKVTRSWPRRRVLAGAVAGIGNLAFLDRSPVAAATTPEKPVRHGPELETLVRLIEETPRDRLIEAAAEKIRGGTGYRDLLAATFLAGVRGIRARPVGFEFHCVLAVHSAHLAAEGGPRSDRFMPVLWAMDNFKDAQVVKRRKGQGDWVLPVLGGARLPAPAQARRRYLEAMAAWDEEGADLAITALARSTPAEQIRDLLFRHGARDFRDIGHKAIYAANAWRTLGVIGWQHAEPVLRSLTFACLEHEGGSPAERDAPADRPWRENLERVKTIRAGWQQGQAEPAAVGELLAVLRRSTPSEGCAAVAKMLNARTAPASLWDALHLFAAELVMRDAEIVSLHAVTSVNALHQAFQIAADTETRLLMLLQAAAFLPMFRQQIGDEYRGGSRVDAIEPAPRTASEAETLGQIFAQIFADMGHGAGQESARATRTALHLLGRGRDQAAALCSGARRLLFAKGKGAHDYKFTSAALEDYQQVSPPYRNRYLAANLALLSGSDEPDNPLIPRARAALT